MCRLKTVLSDSLTGIGLLLINPDLRILNKLLREQLCFAHCNSHQVPQWQPQDATTTNHICLSETGFPVSMAPAAANKNLKKPRDHMIQDSGLQILVQWSKDSDGAQVQVTLFQQAFLQPIRRCSSIFIGHSKSTIQTGLQLIVVILFILQ